MGHSLQVQSDLYLEVDQQTLPTGKQLEVKNTKYDYREVKVLKNSSFTGLDDTFILNDSESTATLNSEQSGISMKVSTNQPAIVVCTPKSLPKLNYSNGTSFDEYPAICFETQNFPDAPHHKSFPSSLLLPDQVYRNESTFEFGIVP